MSDLIVPYLDWCRAAGHSARTIDLRHNVLIRADAALPYGLEQSVETELIAWLSRPSAAATRYTYHHVLSGFYRWATRPGHPVLDANPMSDMPSPRKPKGRARPVPDDLVLDVLRRADDPYRLFVLLALFAGLRCIEIAGLRREDVTQHQIDIRNAKGGDAQTVPTHPEIWRTVEHFPAGSLVEHAGGVADASWVSIRSALYFRRKLGLTISMHRFRHSFACGLRRQGNDLFVVKDLMRHASVRSTEIYVETGTGERASAVASLPVPTPAAI